MSCADFAVASHVGWGNVQGKFFTSFQEANEYYSSRPWNQAHMLITPHRQIRRYYGARGGRDKEMLDWWQRQIDAGCAHAQPCCPEAIDSLLSAGHLHERIPPKEKQCRGAVLVLPGGGYKNVEIGYEGVKIAEWFCARGFAAFALKYTLEPRNKLLGNRARGVEPAVEEGVSALRIIQERASELGLGGGKTCIIGFSAGAHLAMCICRRIVEVPEVMQPQAMVLAYPPARNPLCACILGGVCKWSPAMLVSNDVDGIWDHVLSDDSQHKWCDLEAFADAAPSTLLVASTEDGLLPPKKNTDPIAAVLRRKNVPLEYVKRDFGAHGFALRGWESELENWLAIDFAEESS
eukprot:gnl/MRDRNA2_/MRDRNA2_127139_c0_seq1.p1 gnl/MRDRNA2_/MRDRNA2_127139_c0~~gnl/MRDRNA2_/MRDRNA2_127139_c0_seq1.p1  ORF type:complete len:349 (-),score=64.84 gnl/MRDRNA2_/MRDRNA2_127139_c0_seq1:175-1221(-)